MSENTTTRAVNLPDFVWQRVSMFAAGNHLSLDDAMTALLRQAIRAHYAPLAEPKA